MSNTRQGSSSSLSSIVPDPQRKTLEMKDVETHVELTITKKINQIGAWIITIIISIAIGGVGATLWEMNGKIHTIIGQEMVRNEIEEILREKIDLLEKYNAALVKENNSLKNNKKQE